MGRCMNKCKGEIPIGEKAICPLNAKHESFAEEVDHKPITVVSIPSVYRVTDDCVTNYFSYCF